MKTSRSLTAYARAVYEWNAIIHYKQTIPEMGYALQYLGSALIDCNILSIFSAEYNAHQLTGENLATFDSLLKNLKDSYLNILMIPARKNSNQFMRTLSNRERKQKIPATTTVST